jgi:hypothetical protein
MHEHENIQFDDLDQILQQAHLRRSADFGRWLRQYLEDHRRTERRKAANARSLNTIISFIIPSRRQAV